MRKYHRKDFSTIISLIVVIVVVGIIGAAIVGSIVNSTNKINEGYITDKYYNAGGTHYSSDKNGGHLYSYPSQYFFTIQGRKDGKTVEYTFEVTQTEYEAYKIGDWYKR